ncbi:unnamed protein product [Bursaphelenchus xylophilus]|uniref:(pine wood nematode) hypothetical protein n=1 Tax=Bursaphelenchus xylophilus TaxID=6326 RepID=A0A1I7S240_BURXY|nr:unnamed protein product [Bursaphelenchus xylophilus]CAG9114940.1 unnamed protein product [Bursaphelenchus xylophilus]
MAVCWTFSAALACLLAVDVYAQSSNVSNCVDSDAKCPLWASQGECQSNAVWMMSNCRRSCQSCQGGDQAWKLRSQITQNYDNSTQNVTKLVTVESVRLNHVEIDESRQLVRVFGRLVMSWNDSKITWDKDQWGISWLNFYWIQIWTPQLVQINAPSTQPGTVQGKVLAANYTGQVYMWSDFSFTAPYHFEYNDFPNDYQKICYKFDDKRYFTVRFKVSPEVKDRSHEAISETHITGWNIVDMTLTDSQYVIQVLGDWKKNPFDVQTNNCELCVTLKRNAVYYVAEMLLPALVNTLITLSSIFFQLSKVQPTLLAFSIGTQILSLILINSRLPNFSSSTPTILSYAAFNLAITSILFITSLALRRLSQSTSNIPPPNIINRIVDLVETVLPLPQPTKDAEDSQSSHYSRVAHVFNNLIYGIVACLYIVIIVFSFLF